MMMRMAMMMMTACLPSAAINNTAESKKFRPDVDSAYSVELFRGRWRVSRCNTAGYCISLGCCMLQNAVSMGSVKDAFIEASLLTQQQCY